MKESETSVKSVEFGGFLDDQIDPALINLDYAVKHIQIWRSIFLPQTRHQDQTILNSTSLTDSFRFVYLLTKFPNCVIGAAPNVSGILARSCLSALKRPVHDLLSSLYLKYDGLNNAPMIYDQAPKDRGVLTGLQKISDTLHGWNPAFCTLVGSKDRSFMSDDSGLARRLAIISGNSGSLTVPPQIQSRNLFIGPLEVAFSALRLEMPEGFDWHAYIETYQESGSNIPEKVGIVVKPPDSSDATTRSKRLWADRVFQRLKDSLIVKELEKSGNGADVVRTTYYPQPQLEIDLRLSRPASVLSRFMFVPTDTKKPS